MNILQKTFEILPKSIQISVLSEDLKRVEAWLEYHKGLVNNFEYRKEELCYKLRKLGVDK